MADDDILRRADEADLAGDDTQALRRRKPARAAPKRRWATPWTAANADDVSGFRRVEIDRHDQALDPAARLAHR